MATKRRAAGEGSYYEQDGRWKGRAVVRTASGEKARVCVSGATREEAVDRLRAKLAEVEAGVVKATRGTVGDLLDTWLDANRAIRPTTRAFYEGCIGKLKAGLGTIKASELTALQIDGFLRELEATDSARGRQMLFGTLRTAYRWAVKKNLVVRSPVDRADPVKVEAPEIRAWSKDEVRTFLASVDNVDRYAALWTLALSSGMRQGEMLALSWSDVDLAGKRVKVRHTLLEVNGKVLGLGPPKSKAGVRTVAINGACVRALIRHREHLMSEGLAASEKVFPAVDGGWMEKSTVRHALKKAIQKAGVSQIAFHDLRHTHATILIEAGVNPRVVQERLGHSDVVLTLRRYTKVSSEAAEQAAEVMAAAL